MRRPRPGPGEKPTATSASSSAAPFASPSSVAAREPSLPASAQASAQARADFYVNLSKEKEWALIILEVKLFVTRYPEVKERLRRAEEELEDSVEEELVELFGINARAAGKALGGIFSALVLEADLEPDVLTERKLRAMLGTSFDALLGLRIKAQTKAAQ